MVALLRRVGPVNVTWPRPHPVSQDLSRRAIGHARYDLLRAVNFTPVGPQGGRGEVGGRGLRGRHEGRSARLLLIPGHGHCDGARAAATL